MNKIKLGVSVTSLYLKLSATEIETAKKKLSKYFEVRLYLPKVKPDIFGSLSLERRINSINQAAAENEVVLSYAGGFNQIELLQRFDELKFNKTNIFVGQSDNTILANALPTLKICNSLYGKGFFNIAKDPDYGEEMVEELYKAVLKLKSGLNPDRNSPNSQAPILVGGNNYTFDLLQGTRFCPKFDKPFILFMEGEDLLKDSSETWVDFIRNIDSVMLQEGAIKNLRRLVIGRFPAGIKLKSVERQKFVTDRDYLNDIPIWWDYDCGHNKKSYKYLPIGQSVPLDLLNLNYG